VIGLAGHLISSQLGSTENVEEYCDSENIAAPGAAVDPPEAAFDPDLVDVIKHWSELSKPVKAGILAMVRSSSKGTKGT
jgi:hypothetical protein